jgi:hypothetical protein
MSIVSKISFAAMAAVLCFGAAPQAEATTGRSADKVCFDRSINGKPTLKCYSRQWAEQNGYDLSEAYVPEPRTKNSFDDKICFTLKGVSVPSLRCYNKAWAEANGWDMSKGTPPERLLPTHTSRGKTDCFTRTENGKPKRVCHSDE